MYKEVQYPSAVIMGGVDGISFSPNLKFFYFSGKKMKNFPKNIKLPPPNLDQNYGTVCTTNIEIISRLLRLSSLLSIQLAMCFFIFKFQWRTQGGESQEGCFWKRWSSKNSLWLICIDTLVFQILNYI